MANSKLGLPTSLWVLLGVHRVALDADGGLGARVMPWQWLRRQDNLPWILTSSLCGFPVCRGAGWPESHSKTQGRKIYVEWLWRWCQKSLMTSYCLLSVAMVKCQDQMQLIEEGVDLGWRLQRKSPQWRGVRQQTAKAGGWLITLYQVTEKRQWIRGTRRLQTLKAYTQWCSSSIKVTPPKSLII